MIKSTWIRLACTSLWLCFASFLSARPESRFWGALIDGTGAPAVGIRVSLASATGETLAAETDGRGGFQIPGLPRGRYALECGSGDGSAKAEAAVEVGTSETIYARLKLLETAGGKTLVVEILLHDYADPGSATTIDEPQMRLLPSGNSVWSLIENQDDSATTNRIDVGGVWTGRPALYSARGGTSWTQNTFRLNGMDITDPRMGGFSLLYPDFWSLDSMSLQNAGFSAAVGPPGGVLDLVTRDGGDEIRGSVSAYYSSRRFSSSNITPALKKEGLFENTVLNDSSDLHFDLSGPIVPGKLAFFASATRLSASRDIPEFSGDDTSAVLSGLARLKYDAGNTVWTFLWTGQEVKNPSDGAGRDIPFASTLNRKDTFNVLQADATFRLGKDHILTAGAGFSRADFLSRFQDGASGPHGIEVLRNIPSGPAASAEQSRRERWTFLVRGEVFDARGGTSHRLEYGADFKRASADSSEEVRDLLHLRTFEGKPLEVVRFAASEGHRESLMEGSAFVQETMIFPNRIAATLGLRFDILRGRGEGNATGIDWSHFSPRIGLTFPLSRTGRTSLRIFAGRYYSSLPLSHLTYGNPGTLGGLAYEWIDGNGDGLFQEGETGRLLRREGPLYGGIDPSLVRPHTDELSIGVIRRTASGFYFSLTGYLRETRGLVETLNTGVPFSSYESRTIADIGDDRISGTHDDLTFDLFEQREDTFGRDFLYLTNPDAEDRRSTYKGLDLVLSRKTSSRFAFFVALTATEAIGTTSPGDSEWENDDGVVGTLYDNPNTLINARGRLRFDRAYTGRIGVALRLPLGIRLGYLLKYYDGQPFARRIVVTGFRQGPFYIMAHPRGVSRYEFNMTNDIRLQKSFSIGSGSLRIILDGFNIFNQHLATAENGWTGPEYPLRFATDIESPRIFRLGLSYEF
ncbi:MAG: carboxypeptidase regulatory-like domain-containing protein [Candidatus Aminicenantales bacterium]